MDAPDQAAEIDIPAPVPTGRKVRERLWTVFLVVAAALCTFMLASFAMTVVAAFVVHGTLTPASLRDPDFMTQITSSRIGFMLVVIVPQLALIGPCLVAAYLSPVPMLERLGLERGHWPMWAWGCAMFATPLVGTLSGFVGGLFLEESEHLKDLSGIFRDHGASGFLIPMALLIGITPAVCEELLFRGYVQTRLAKSLGPFVGLLLASILFAVFHLDFVHVVSVFPIGLFLGWVSLKSGSLVPAMLGHFLNNSLGVVIVVNAPADETDTLALPTAIFLTWILFAGILGVMGTIAASVLFRSSPDEPVATMADTVPAVPAGQQDSLNGEPVA